MPEAAEGSEPTEPEASGPPLEPSPGIDASPAPTAEPSLPPLQATASPGSFTFELVAENHRGSAAPGRSVDHGLVLVRVESGEPSAGPQIEPLLSVSSGEDWLVAVMTEDGRDVMADGALADALARDDGGSVPLVVRVTVPDDARAGDTHVTTISVASPVDAAASSIDLVTTVDGHPTIQVTGSDVAFGGVSPVGSVDPSLAGRVAVSTDREGASYVIRDAVTVAVTSDVPWSLDCLFREATVAAKGGGTSEMLTWRPSGTAKWRAFTTGGSGPSACVADHPPGEVVLAFDVRLRVEWTDAPAAIGGHVTFSARSR